MSFVDSASPKANICVSFVLMFVCCKAQSRVFFFFSSFFVFFTTKDKRDLHQREAGERTDGWSRA